MHEIFVQRNHSYTDLYCCGPRNMHVMPREIFSLLSKELLSVSLSSCNSVLIINPETMGHIRLQVVYS